MRTREIIVTTSNPELAMRPIESPGDWCAEPLRCQEDTSMSWRAYGRCRHPANQAGGYCTQHGGIPRRLLRAHYTLLAQEPATTTPHHN